MYFVLIGVFLEWQIQAVHVSCSQCLVTQLPMFTRPSITTGYCQQPAFDKMSYCSLENVLLTQS